MSNRDLHLFEADNDDRHEVLSSLLTRIASARDREAFSDLYDRVAGVLFSTILSIVKDRAEAEDVLQETFTSIWRHAGQYRGDRSQAISWMLTIARNKSHDHLGKRNREDLVADRMYKEMPLQSTSGAATSVDGSAFLIAQETSSEVRRALASLPAEQERAIRMTFLEGMTQTEVAQQLETPLGTIKARIRRGLYQMRGALYTFYKKS